MKVIVIGAGWAGLQLAALFKNTYNCDILIVDQNDSIGGTWADGVAYDNLVTHSPASTFEFVGFPFPKDIISNAYSRVKAKDVVRYMKRYIDRVNLSDNFKLNTKVTSVNQISKNDVECDIINVKTGNKTTLKANFVIVSGIGFKAKNPPKFNNSIQFNGKIYNSHEINSQVISELKKLKKPVTVLGGSKSAHDILNTLSKNNISSSWIARKTYWMVNYDKCLYDHSLKKIANPLNRLKCFFAHIFFGFYPKIVINFMKSNNLMLNVHPETSNTDYHLGVIKEKTINVLSKIPFFQGEIDSLKSDSIDVKNVSGKITKNIPCGAIIACFGTDITSSYPNFKSKNKSVEILKIDHLFQFSIHYELPRVYFTSGSIPYRGIGMLNGYHSAQHAIKYLSKKMTRSQIKKMQKEESVILKNYFGKTNVTPQLKRSISELPNISSYLQLVDKFARSIQYSKPFSLGLIKLTWIGYFKIHQSKPVYSEPSRYEIKKAVGKTPAIYNTYGIPKRLRQS